MSDAPVMERPRKRRGTQKISKAQRARIEETIARLIDVVDTLDAPGEDMEASLGSTDATYQPAGWYASRGDANARLADREHDAGDEGEPDVDDEPSLAGAITVDQSRWSSGDTNECEDDDESEPSLGATAAGDQRVGWSVRRAEVSEQLADREQDAGDEAELFDGDDESDNVI